MLVMLESKEELNRYNLALCVLQEGKLRDDVVTNNGDFSKILMTVAVCLEVFFGKLPNAVVEIAASDEKRLRVYNGIFQRKHLEILLNFVVKGVLDERKELYHPDNFYHKFEIQRRKA